MKKALTWIFIIAMGLALVGWVFAGRSDRQAYRTARGAISARTQMSQDRIDAAVEMATTAVDAALVAAGDLPSQQAKADLVKQDIEEIGNRLKDASQARGDAAIEKLNASIEQFNKAMQTVDDASNSADSPVVKAKLDRIYGMLDAVKNQLVEGILKTQE